jgi:hypothetical protein
MIRLSSTEVLYEKLIGYTIGVDIVDGAVCKGDCFGQTVDCQTWKIVPANATHALDMNEVEGPSRQLITSLFLKLPSIPIPNSRGEATTMPVRARVTKEMNETIVSGATWK